MLAPRRRHQRVRECGEVGEGTQQAVALDEDPQHLLTDRPQPWFALLVVGVLGLLLWRWRVRE